MAIIKVNYEVYGSSFLISKALNRLLDYPRLSFDTETKGIYTKAERAEAVQLLKDEGLPLEHKRLAYQVAANTGLSFPSLVNVTHFIFGLDEANSIIILSDDPKTELKVWDWVKSYPGTLAIHNALFDLKIMYHRVGALPNDYVDTSLMAKCLINHTQIWKAKTDLKTLMGRHYDPKWSAFDSYEPDDIRNKAFLDYAAIDGAALMLLWKEVEGMFYEAN